MKPTTSPELIDHIGWDLWRVTEGWKNRFTTDMVVRGFGWFGEARGNLLQHIGRNGVAQTALAAKAGMTKQAVQQHLDDLVRDGAIERVPDPDDARRKIIRFTALGFEAMTVANDVKRTIEDEYRHLIGGDAMDGLTDALRAIIAHQDDLQK
ncbi:MarR family winged helix-turn-helix transcriptional regulator [Pararhizobium sp. IMCC21322]|uniref:MarR family winged helix-turn-helix transcriptional regulator n=1 Tax=Pararhizobium sp. IMCC21322 TaxID=3067903 RepID=UPI0027415BE7|nr:MarR family winged helix-turn-helix transcriptional regulator [Pararhizobium sp. IMCC21322]